MKLTHSNMVSLGFQKAGRFYEYKDNNRIVFIGLPSNKRFMEKVLHESYQKGQIDAKRAIREAMQ